MPDVHSLVHSGLAAQLLVIHQNLLNLKLAADCASGGTAVVTQAEPHVMSFAIFHTFIDHLLIVLIDSKKKTQEAVLRVSQEAGRKIPRLRSVKAGYFLITLHGYHDLYGYFLNILMHQCSRAIISQYTTKSIVSQSPPQMIRRLAFAGLDLMRVVSLQAHKTRTMSTFAAEI